MTDLIIHKNEYYIEEDLAYYFSDRRDINNQIRPKTNIYSLTPSSTHFNIDFNDEKVGSLFFPIAPFSVDRIYIGVSFPLFANNWGAAFLSYLMTRVTTKGSVILPVYPEIQASEKNFWSRSILENVFLSRSRWKGTSNISAENDGVMSLRIGRVFPKEIKSTATFFFQESGNCILRRSFQVGQKHSSNQKYLSNMGYKYWDNANTYSIVERIINDYFGMKMPLTLCEIGGDNDLMALECIFSDYINITRAVSFTPIKTLTKDTMELSNRYFNDIKSRFITITTNIFDSLNYLASYNIICLINASKEGLSLKDMKMVFESAMEKLAPGGILIIHEAQGLSDDLVFELERYPNIQYYSSIVASKLNKGEVISHYCSLVEAELVKENHNRKSTFRVLRK